MIYKMILYSSLLLLEISITQKPVPRGWLLGHKCPWSYSDSWQFKIRSCIMFVYEALKLHIFLFCCCCCLLFLFVCFLHQNNSEYKEIMQSQSCVSYTLWKTKHAHVQTEEFCNKNLKITRIQKFKWKGQQLIRIRLHHLLSVI